MFCIVDIDFKVMEVMCGYFIEKGVFFMIIEVDVLKRE